MYKTGEGDCMILRSDMTGLSALTVYSCHLFLQDYNLRYAISILWGAAGFYVAWYLDCNNIPIVEIFASKIYKMLWFHFLFLVREYNMQQFLSFRRYVGMSLTTEFLQK
jgi:hypothetical protein